MLQHLLKDVTALTEGCYSTYCKKQLEEHWNWIVINVIIL